MPTNRTSIKALRAGIADYYQKPINLHELLEGLQRQEAALQERQKDLELGHLNQKLQYLSASHRRPLPRPRQGAQQPATSTDQRHRGARGGSKATAKMPVIFKQLSPRQLDVARLVGKGQTNYQIACELGITENTVKLYVSQVLRLTHMHNRTQLALALSPSNSAIRQRVTRPLVATARRGTALLLIVVLGNRVLVALYQAQHGPLAFRGGRLLRLDDASWPVTCSCSQPSVCFC